MWNREPEEGEEMGREEETVASLSHPKVRVELGQVFATPGALEALEAARVSPGEIIHLHASGDWGDLDAEDKAANDQALLDGSRLLSAYQLPTGTKVWVITEWDRTVTTLLLPEEY